MADRMMRSLLHCWVDISQQHMQSSVMQHGSSIQVDMAHKLWVQGMHWSRCWEDMKYIDSDQLRSTQCYTFRQDRMSTRHLDSNILRDTEHRTLTRAENKCQYYKPSTHFDLIATDNIQESIVGMMFEQLDKRNFRDRK